MTPLEDLLDLAARSSSSTVELLRKVKILAARTNNNALARWTDLELSGYPAGADLPDYRGPFPVQLFARYHLIGAGDADVMHPISEFSFTPHGLQLAADLFVVRFTESAASIEAAQRNITGSCVRILPKRIIDIFNYMVETDDFHVQGPYRVAELQQRYADTLFATTLEGIRDRVIATCLELQRQTPSVSPTMNNVEAVQGNQRTLLRLLMDLGVSTDGVLDLKQALDADTAQAAPEAIPGPGDHVHRWLGDYLTSPSDTAAQRTRTTALEVVNLVRRYFGIQEI